MAEGPAAVAFGSSLQRQVPSGCRTRRHSRRSNSSSPKPPALIRTGRDDGPSGVPRATPGSGSSSRSIPSIPRAWNTLAAVSPPVTTSASTRRSAVSVRTTAASERASTRAVCGAWRSSGVRTVRTGAARVRRASTAGAGSWPTVTPRTSARARSAASCRRVAGWALPTTTSGRRAGAGAGGTGPASRAHRRARAAASPGEPTHRTSSRRGTAATRRPRSPSVAAEQTIRAPRSMRPGSSAARSGPTATASGNRVVRSEHRTG